MNTFKLIIDGKGIKYTKSFKQNTDKFKKEIKVNPTIVLFNNKECNGQHIILDTSQHIVINVEKIQA